MIRTYLEWILCLPWTKSTEDNLDIPHARKMLDADHYDIEKVKERILDYLAVRKLKPDSKGSILCFVGPPGVGKTSLGKSIAEALGREFERISVGGVRDEAEIRGHRRTYIGAMPGTIIRALRDAGSNNPVFMIDEIDKMGTDFRGDPASAMLEVLDPEQNESFRDHYLDLPFDLSNVMFITTANVLEAIPGPLRDRMEVIQLSGYTAEEKHQIAKRYLIPRQIERNGLKPDQIDDQGRGDRHRDLASTRARRACATSSASSGRSAARSRVEFAEGKAKRHVTVTAPRGARDARPAARLLGGPPAHAASRVSPPGSRGRPSGGDVLFVEAADYPGSGKLIITGQLGDVMRESAQAALSFVRAQRRASCSPASTRTSSRGTTSTCTCPPGRSPRTGRRPASRWRPRCRRCSPAGHVRDDTAMTGELTLTGQVLPIGGLKEKGLAAQAAGIERVIAPKLNRQDVEDIPRAPDARPRVHLGGPDRGGPRRGARARRRPAQRPHLEARRDARREAGRQPRAQAPEPPADLRDPLARRSGYRVACFRWSRLPLLDRAAVRPGPLVGGGAQRAGLAERAHLRDVAVERQTDGPVHHRAHLAGRAGDLAHVVAARQPPGGEPAQVNGPSRSPPPCSGRGSRTTRASCR